MPEMPPSDHDAALSRMEDDDRPPHGHQRQKKAHSSVQ
jgi:hypothetical protein